MSRYYFDTNKDVDSEEEVQRRRAFIDRMERKYKFKKSALNLQH